MVTAAILPMVSMSLGSCPLVVVMDLVEEAAVAVVAAAMEALAVVVVVVVGRMVLGITGASRVLMIFTGGAMACRGPLFPGALLAFPVVSHRVACHRVVPPIMDLAMDTLL